MSSVPPSTITLLGADGERRVSVPPGHSAQAALVDAGLAPTGSCNGQALCGQCRVQLVDGDASAPTPGEHRLLRPTELEVGQRLACQLRPRGDIVLTRPLVAAHQAWRALREDEYFPQPVPPQPRRAARPCGLAIDLGTTHIRLSLWDLPSARRLAGRAGLNPQIPAGADVLSRLAEATRSPASAARLQAWLTRAIAAELATLTAGLQLPTTDIGEVRIVGNTAMLSLLAGRNQALLLDPDNWTRAIDVSPADPAALRAAWGLAADCRLDFVPPLGGFVGSDLLAGILATGLCDGPANALLVDFGTNSELALWDGERLHITSTSGGPAFEGSGISCGMPGETGAIYRIEAGPRPGDWHCRVLGDAPARGICGSGLVDALALLRQQDLLSPLGRLRLPPGQSGQPLDAGAAGLQLSPADIDVFQRAKAAIGAGIRWLCDEAGIPPGQIQRIHACGAFGRLLDIAHAQAIGLLPTIPVEQVSAAANSALAGCESLLFAAPGTDPLAAIRHRARLFNLSQAERFEMLFIENLYIQPLPA